MAYTNKTKSKNESVLMHTQWMFWNGFVMSRCKYHGIALKYLTITLSNLTSSSPQSI